MSGDEQDDGIIKQGDQFSVANEFTGAALRKVWTRQGERLEVTVPKKGYRILLDAMQLEIVAAQDPKRFTELFAIKLGSAEENPEEGR